MKFSRLAFLLISFLFISKISIAAKVYAWSIDGSNLVSNKLYLSSTGATNVVVNVDLDRTAGESGINVQYALATKTSTGAVQLLSSVFTATGADYTEDLYGYKSVTASISNSNVINGVVYLVTDPTGQNNFSFLSGDYLVTNTLPASTIYWSHTSSTGLVSGTELQGNTTFAVSGTPILTSGQTMYSSNNSIMLALQTDGNLVIYQVAGMKVLWASNTNNNQAKYLFFQADGNLVLTKTTDISTHVWASNIYATGGNTGNAKYAIFLLQNDGNRVMMISSIYNPPTHPGAYWVLGDTGSGNLTVSRYFGQIK